MNTQPHAAITARLEGDKIVIQYPNSTLQYPADEFADWHDYYDRMEDKFAHPAGMSPAQALRDLLREHPELMPAPAPEV